VDATLRKLLKNYQDIQRRIASLRYQADTIRQALRGLGYTKAQMDVLLETKTRPGKTKRIKRVQL
jgi:prefoldin subunit 5